DQLERLLVAGLVMPSQQELEHGRRRELRRAAEAAPLRVERPLQPAHRLAEERLRQRLGGRRDRGGLLQGTHGRPGLASHVATTLSIRIGDRNEQLPEGRQAVPRLWWEIGAAEKRLPRRQEKYGHRPAAVPRHRNDRVHVERVEVRPFLTVD